MFDRPLNLTAVLSIEVVTKDLKNRVLSDLSIFNILAMCLIADISTRGTSFKQRGERRVRHKVEHLVLITLSC